MRASRRSRHAEIGNDLSAHRIKHNCVHFVGFRDDRYINAVRVFGRPDFVHPRWDERARREIADGDTVIFATGDGGRAVSVSREVMPTELEPRAPSAND